MEQMGPLDRLVEMVSQEQVDKMEPLDCLVLKEREVYKDYQELLGLLDKQ